MNQHITTPIYYASGAPHLGHLYTTLVAACLKRHSELKDVPARLTTGTDEFGQKIERTAGLAGLSPEAFVAERSEEFRSLWQHLSIPIDRFERTTDDGHQAVAHDLWQRLSASGDLYKGRYEGLYCVECEQYFVSGTDCPIHRKPLEHFAEESYFFRLSRYQDRLVAFLRANPHFIRPESRYREVVSFVEGNDLHDLSVSRTSTRWGVPVPGDERHVIYVWIEALASYLSALGPLDSAETRRWWPGTVHCIGKDILTFHAVYWPAILWSAGLTLPAGLLVNGWLTVEGRKIAKSDPLTIVDPIELADTFGSDALTLYFLKKVTLGQDLDFSRRALAELANAELANNLGNLFARVTGLLRRSATLAPATEQAELRDELGEDIGDIRRALDDCSLTEAVRLFTGLADRLNRDIQNREPWHLPEGDERDRYLNTLYGCLLDLTVVGSVFIPETMTRARCLLGQTGKPSYSQLGQPLEVRLGRQEALYPRLSIS